MQPKSVVFPDISSKSDLIYRVLVEDQIILVDVSNLAHLASHHDIDGDYRNQNLFSEAECRQFVQFIDSQPLELTPSRKKGEADRVNCASNGFRPENTIIINRR